MWAEKKEPGTHCLRMLSSPRISGNLGNFRKTCPLHKPPRDMPTFHAREMSATHYMLCVDDDEGVIKAISSSLTGIIHASMRSSSMLWHVTDAIFPFEVYRSS